ncbi:MAG: hypothetical protein J7J61_07140 [Candidatus Hydrothermae bacterium]|nr:hypothetical protein [Candidatus Hydrothermae bacterium]
MTDWKELIGKRVLLRTWVPGLLKEAKILEVSPEGKAIRVKWMSKGWEEWLDIGHFNLNYKLVEVLD